MVKECMDPVTCMLPVMLPILPEPVCPVFVLRFVLLFSLVGALSPPGNLLLSHWHSLSCWVSVHPLLQCSCSVYFQSFSPKFLISSPADHVLSSQLISKKNTGYLLSFTLNGTPYITHWYLSSLSSRIPVTPFPFIDGPLPLGPCLSLFRGTYYPSLSFALSIPLVPDLSLPLKPRIWGLRVLRCHLARTLAAIVSSAVLSLSLPCCRLAIDDRSQVL